MKMKTKAIVLICLLVTALCVMSGCSEKSIFDSYNEDGFNISIRFDANGGTMMGQATAIVDAYNIANMERNANGEVEIALLDPTDTRRGTGNICEPNYGESGYYLAGWYTERTENPNGEGYVYSNPWDFESDRVRVNPDKTNSSSEPVLTLYAVWKPLLQVEFYDRATNTKMEKVIQYDPNLEQIRLPEWKVDGTGAISMNQFPENPGYTFDAAYYDLEGTQKIDTEVLVHPGETDANARTMKVYLDWLEGEWYHIFTAKQLFNLADPKGNYVICNDLDFTNVKWPTAFMYNKFEGKIVTLNNQSFTLRNIVATQDQEKTDAGLFGWITEDAVISNVTFDNATFTINKGSTKPCYFGLFSSNISDAAKIDNVSIINSKIVIAAQSKSNFDNYWIGLVSPRGNYQCLTQTDITCSFAESMPYDVSVEGNDVYITEK